MLISVVSVGNTTYIVTTKRASGMQLFSIEFHLLYVFGSGAVAHFHLWICGGLTAVLSRNYKFGWSVPLWRQERI